MRRYTSKEILAIWNPQLDKEFKIIALKNCLNNGIILNEYCKGVMFNEDEGRSKTINNKYVYSCPLHVFIRHEDDDDISYLEFCTKVWDCNECHKLFKGLKDSFCPCDIYPSEIIKETVVNHIIKLKCKERK